MDNHVSLSTQMDELRRRARGAVTAGEMELVLDDARAVLKQAFQTDQEDEARDLFRQLRDKKQSLAVAAGLELTGAPPDRLGQLSRRVQRERLRLSGGGSLDDMELSVDGLVNALHDLTPADRETPLRQEILNALGAAAGLHGQLRRKVMDALDNPEDRAAPDVQHMLARLPQGPATASESGAPTTADAAQDMTQDMARARRMIYAGDYYEAIEALTAILRMQPDHAEAGERLAQVEDNIKRGIVPDARVPYEARVAFGRAQSLERAGRIEEARLSYTLALEESRKGGPLLQNWLPAVEALLRIDNSIIAREARDEADAMLRDDRWPEAAAQYEVVLQLLPDDAAARERLGQVRKLLNFPRVLRTPEVQKTDHVVESAQVVLEARQVVDGLLPRLPDSQQLAALDGEINEAARTLATALLERSQQLVAHVRFVPNVSEGKSLYTEAVDLLDKAHQLALDDPQVADQLQSVRAELKRLGQADDSLAEVRRLAGLDTFGARREARDLLINLREYDQDPDYLKLVASLQRQYLSEAEHALRQNDLRTADHRLADARQEPFGMLEASNDLLRLESDLAAARRRPWVRALAWTVGAAVLLAALAVVVRPLGLFKGLAAASAPQPTVLLLPTATLAPASTVTPAPSPTLLPTASPTDRPTATQVWTPTPAYTPTAVPLYGAIKENTAARLSPNGGSPWAFTLRAADPVQVLAETRDEYGNRWLKILYVRGDSTLIGWAQARDVNVLPTPIP